MRKNPDQVTRRTFLLGSTSIAAGALALSAGLVGTTTSARAEGATLRIVTGGGTFEEALKKAQFQPFEAANPGVSILLDAPDDPARLKAMVEAGNVTADLWLTGDFFGFDSDAEWLEPLDYSKFDASALAPQHRMKYRVGNEIEDTLFAYRTDHFTAEQPKNFTDYFNIEKFPGKRAAWKYVSGGIIEAALVADGVPVDKLYPIDVDRAFKKLETIRDNLIWYDTGAQAQQLLVSGEASIGQIWGSRIFTVIDAAPLAVSWDQWISAGGWWMIPKGAGNRDLAYKALSYFLSLEPQKAITKYLPYGPTNLAAAQDPNPKYKGNLPTDHKGTQVAINYEWWVANQSAVDERFQEWLLGS